MKISLPVLLILFGLFFFSYSGYSQQSEFSMISPLPGSKFINPEQTILIKTNLGFDTSSIGASMFSVIGSESGHHGFNINISNDNNSIILIPEKYFAYGETVTVKIYNGLKSRSGESFEGKMYSFKIKQAETLSLLRKYKQSPSYDFCLPLADNSEDVSVNNKSRDNNLPFSYPSPEVTFYNTDNLDDQYIFINLSSRQHPIYRPYITIWDKFGTPVYYQKKERNCLNFHMLQDGSLTFGYNDLANPEKEKYYLMDSSFVIYDSVTMGNGYHVDAHEMLLLENGHYLMFAYDPQIVNMSLIVPGGNPNASVIGLVIQEVDLNQNVFFQWRSWDYFEITDATADIDLTYYEIDYVHGNALEIDDDGNILLSSRNMDEITKINFNNGNIIWRFGKNSENNMFDIYNDPFGFSHQHDIRRTWDGKYSVYDNGNLHNPQFSQALEYDIDEDNLQANLIWDYQRTGVFAWATGSYRKYENGRKLICWGTHDPLNVTELNPDNSLAYDIRIPANISTYRAQKFNWETNMFGAKKLVSFGNYAGHEGPVELKLYVFNYSNQGIKITSTHNHLDSYTVLSQLPISILPGENKVLRVSFSPSNEGEYQDLLTLNYDNDDNSRRIAIQVELEGIWDEEIPSVFFNPENGATNVNPATSIQVSFDEPVRKVLGAEILDVDIPNLFDFQQDNYLGNNINFSGTINDEKTLITIFPESQLSENQQYYIELFANRIEDYDGNIISNEEVSYFTTGLAIGNNELLEAEIQIFPNPFQDKLSLRFPNDDVRRCVIYDLTGECVLEKISESDKLNIETRSLKSGMYLLRIIPENSLPVSTYKIIKK